MIKGGKCLLLSMKAEIKTQFPENQRMELSSIEKTRGKRPRSSFLHNCECVSNYRSSLLGAQSESLKAIIFYSECFSKYVIFKING